MITPDPAADDARRRGLRRMRTLAVSLLAFAAVVYLATLGQDGFLGFVNAGAEASMVGAIADWFAVTALFKHPLGPARAAHGADPAPQGRAGPQPRGVRRRELPAGGHHPRAGRVGRPSRCGSAAGSPSRPTHAAWSTRSPRSPRSALGKVRDEHIADFVTDALVPRFREEPIAPLAGRACSPRSCATTCTTASSTSPSTSCTVAGRAPRARSPRCSGSGRPGGRRRGSTTRVTRRLHAELVDWLARHPRRPRPPGPPGARLDAGPAGARPAARPRHAGAHRAAQGAAAGAPAGGRVEHRAVERAAPRAAGVAGRPRRAPSARGSAPS